MRAVGHDDDVIEKEMMDARHTTLDFNNVDESRANPTCDGVYCKLFNCKVDDRIFCTLRLQNLKSRGVFTCKDCYWRK